MKKRKVDDGLFEKEVEVLSPEEEARREKEQALFDEQYPELAGSATLDGGPQFFRGLKVLTQRLKDELLFLAGVIPTQEITRHGVTLMYPAGMFTQEELEHTINNLVDTEEEGVFRIGVAGFIPQKYNHSDPYFDHDLDLVNRLLAALEKHQPGDCGSAYRIGIMQGELNARLESQAVQNGRKNTNGRNESIRIRADKKRVVDDCILRYYDMKAAQHIGGPVREICTHTAKEMNKAYQKGNKEGKELLCILRQLKKEEFTAEMVRSRVQARKKQNG